MQERGIILACIDFSQRNKEVLDWAEKVSQVLDLPLHVIHVVEKPFPSTHMEKIPFKEILENFKREREREIDKIVEGRKIDSLTLREGIPAVEILKMARAQKAKMIVLGATGEGNHRPIGTTASKVVRKSTFPVMVTKARRRPSFSKILTYIDLTDSSKRALQIALSFKEKTRSQVIALFVVDNPYEAYIRAVNTSEKAEEIIDSFENAAKDSFYKFLSEFRKKLTPVFEKGHPPEVIPKVCKIRKINVLLLGSQGMEGIQFLLIGNLVEKILRKLPATVIIVKPESFQFTLP